MRRSECVVCSNVLPLDEKGRASRKYCSDACRQMAYRQRALVEQPACARTKNPEPVEQSTKPKVNLVRAVSKRRAVYDDTQDDLYPEWYVQVMRRSADR
jgi:hypothetical protein